MVYFLHLLHASNIVFSIYSDFLLCQNWIPFQYFFLLHLILTPVFQWDVLMNNQTERTRCFLTKIDAIYFTLRDAICYFHVSHYSAVHIRTERRHLKFQLKTLSRFTWHPKKKKKSSTLLQILKVSCSVSHILFWRNILNVVFFF